MRNIILGVAFVLFGMSQSYAESSVWKLQKGDSVLYLGGTCHLLRPSDFPLPMEFDIAYRASDLLVFETDYAKLKDPGTQQALMLHSMYTDGSTIEKYLSPKTYRLLDQYCANNGIPLSGLKQFKPSLIAFTMMAMELAKFNVTQEGVDSFFYQSAKHDRKSVEVFETVEEQIQFITGMGEGNEEAFIKHTLNDMKTIKEQYEAMIDAWRKGEDKKLNKLMVVDLKTKYPELYQKLLVDRNENWLPMIKAYSRTPQKEFILVGVGHLVGPDGIVASLRKNGYSVEKL